MLDEPFPLRVEKFKLLVNRSIIWADHEEDIIQLVALHTPSCFPSPEIG